MILMFSFLFSMVIVDFSQLTSTGILKKKKKPQTQKALLGGSSAWTRPPAVLTSFPTPSAVIYALNARAAVALAQPGGDETRGLGVGRPPGKTAAVPLNVVAMDWRGKKGSLLSEV